jgi:hypothetical protein
MLAPKTVRKHIAICDKFVSFACVRHKGREASQSSLAMIATALRENRFSGAVTLSSTGFYLRSMAVRVSPMQELLIIYRKKSAILAVSARMAL